MEKKVHVFRPSGKMDHDSRALIFDQIHMLGISKIDYFVIDMSDVTHINTFGLGAILGALRLSKKFGFQLIVGSVASESVELFLQITAMDKVLNLCPDVYAFLNTHNSMQKI
ncbi:STAS domain-containing protein [Tumidithrix elongata RA019]|uniref:STAS domain-containing protein n=1 Tax=Tumidithrix elongata BACA0141 TaxID=2716417 RepID=A0AAW9PY00_9CYAN|nr:STAS domain-containing protein [Tumidithrix elongata RA019]